MKAEAADFLKQLQESRSVLLTGPEGPDGDSIGACLALQRVIHQLAPHVRVSVAGRPGHRYGWLPGADQMVPDEDVVDADGVVVLDGDRKRLPPPVARAFANARWRGIVDHHCSTDITAYDIAIFDDQAESTCSLIRQLMQAWGVALDPALATLLYTGLIFDTGGFRYSNTHADSHRFAAELLETGIDHAAIMLKVMVERRLPALRLGARVIHETAYLADGKIALGVCTRAMIQEVQGEDEDTEGIVDALQHTSGVELAVLVIEKANNRVKLSLRSRGKVNVSALARTLDAGGGGHYRAAGVVLPGPLSAVMASLPDKLMAAFLGDPGKP